MILILTVIANFRKHFVITAVPNEIAAQKNYKVEYYVGTYDNYFVDMLKDASKQVKKHYPNAKIFDPETDLFRLNEVMPSERIFR